VDATVVSDPEVPRHGTPVDLNSVRRTDDDAVTAVVILAHGLEAVLVTHPLGHALSRALRFTSSTRVRTSPIGTGLPSLIESHPDLPRLEASVEARFSTPCGWGEPRITSRAPPGAEPTAAPRQPQLRHRRRGGERVHPTPGAGGRPGEHHLRRGPQARCPSAGPPTRQRSACPCRRVLVCSLRHAWMALLRLDFHSPPLALRGPTCADPLSGKDEQRRLGAAARCRRAYGLALSAPSKDPGCRLPASAARASTPQP
jgi:hypothetical protein